MALSMKDTELFLLTQKGCLSSNLCLTHLLWDFVYSLNEMNKERTMWVNKMDDAWLPDDKFYFALHDRLPECFYQQGLCQE